MHSSAVLCVSTAPGRTSPDYKAGKLGKAHLQLLVNVPVVLLSFYFPELVLSELRRDVAVVAFQICYLEGGNLHLLLFSERPLDGRLEVRLPDLATVSHGNPPGGSKVPVCGTGLEPQPVELGFSGNGTIAVTFMNGSRFEADLRGDFEPGKPGSTVYYKMVSTFKHVCCREGTDLNTLKNAIVSARDRCVQTDRERSTRKITRFFKPMCPPS